MKPTIIFDFSGVCVNGMAGVENTLASLLPFSPELIWEQLHGPELLELNLGNIFEDDYWRALNRRYNWNLPIELLKQTIRENYREIDGTRVIIESLRRQNYKLGLVSNHVAEWVDELEKKFGLLKLFNYVIFSYQVKAVKPERSIYLNLLKKLRTDPTNVILIDDEPSNLPTAQFLGIKTILFQTPLQLVQQLSKYGVKVE